MEIENLPKRVKHKVRGSTYEVIGIGEGQVSFNANELGRSIVRIVREGTLLVFYRDEESGKLWWRFPEEFADGRFEAIPLEFAFAGPYSYVPIPINAAGEGPEMDKALVVRTQHQIWDANALFVAECSDPATARFVVQQLNAPVIDYSELLRLAKDVLKEQSPISLEEAMVELEDEVTRIEKHLTR